MDCRAAGLPMHTSSDASTQELLLDETMGSQQDLDMIYERLEQMKQRAKQLRNLLIRDKPMTKEYVQCVLEIQQKGSRNTEVRAVQQQTLKLVSQLTTLGLQLKRDREQVLRLDCEVQKKHLKSQELHERLEKLYKWPEKVKHQSGKCLERYNDVSINCLDAGIMSPFIKHLHAHFEQAVQNVAPICCYKLDYRRVLKRLQSLSQQMQGSFISLQSITNNLALILREHKRSVQFSRSTMTCSPHFIQSDSRSSSNDNSTDSDSDTDTYSGSKS